MLPGRVMRTHPINPVEAAFRSEWTKLVATMVREVGDLALAEDVVSEAFAEASTRWHSDGVPRRPGAWLLTTARRRAIDRMRRDQRFADRLPRLAASQATSPEPSPGASSGGSALDHICDTDGSSDIDGGSGLDDELALVFGCCHPALAPEAQVALTLRYIGGLSTAQIARAFLVTEATMAKRLVRAKHKVAAAGIPMQIPAPTRLDDRLTSVCTVIHAIFTEGHTSADGAVLVRGDLCDEALYLADTLVRLLPQHHEVLALRALCRLTDARRPSRTDDNGLPVLLRDQDRSRWDRTEIELGLADLAAAQALVPPAGASPYLLHAVLAALHATAANYEQTNWSAIVAAYDSLIAADPNPLLQLNRAIAVGERDGPAIGLAVLDRLWGEHDTLDTYHYLHGARADFLARLERPAEAAAAYDRAIASCDNAAERRWMEARRNSL